MRTVSTESTPSEVRTVSTESTPSEVRTVSTESTPSEVLGQVGTEKDEWMASIVLPAADSTDVEEAHAVLEVGPAAREY